jgi:oligoribonuclease
MNKFCFIDLETTGLNPLKDKILEVGCVITTDKLEEIEVYQAVPHHIISSLEMDSWCLDTHGKSGLLEDVAKSVIHLEDIEKDLQKLVRKHFPVSRPPLAGNSVHFDRRFIELYMPLIHSRFHYRNIDVSSFMLAISNYHGVTLPRATETKHRVLADIRDSISYLRQYLEKFK